MISDKMWKEGLSTRLRKRMNEVGINQKELAEKVFLSPVTILKYLQCACSPSGYTLSLMAEALDCTVGYLVGEEEVK